ncbi:hypothetical protein VO56_00415 [Mycoplasmopsis gallinacea]|uniref:Uncharacterized protein n=1 Tax=Mycoplasmopsis gallinacea TaxID=29556 RepID=A0A0D5ZII5_9BACT|nr:hypothetical protein VO56_00415 [Mycoplasmopsis gallinacea]
MVVKWTLQRAIIEVSLLEEKQDNLRKQISSFVIPVPFDLKDTPNPVMRKKQKKVLDQFLVVSRNILEIKKAINKANQKHGIIDMIQQNKVLRDNSNFLRFVLRSEKINVEHMGIISYQTLIQEEIEKILRDNDEKIANNTKAIELKNSKVNITVNIK